MRGKLRNNGYSTTRGLHGRLMNALHKIFAKEQTTIFVQSHAAGLLGQRISTLPAEISCK